MQDLDNMASDGEAKFIESVRKEMRRKCKEVRVWAGIYKTALDNKYLQRQLDESIEYAVGHYEPRELENEAPWSYHEARKIEDIVKKGDFGNTLVTERLIYEVFEEMIKIVDKERKDESRKEAVGVKEPEIPKEDKDKDTRAGLNKLIGACSTKWSDQFHYQFQEFHAETIPAMYKTVKEWAFATEANKAMYLAVKGLEGKAPEEWFRTPGGAAIKKFACEAASIMVQQAVKLTTDQEVPLEKMKKVTLPGYWGEMGRSAAKDLGKSLQGERAVERQLVGPRGGYGGHYGGYHRGRGGWRGGGGRVSGGGYMPLKMMPEGESAVPTKEKKDVCHNCNKPGHMARECTEKKYCYECQQNAGHLAKECPLRVAKMAKKEENAAKPGGKK